MKVNNIYFYCIFIIFTSPRMYCQSGDADLITKSLSLPYKLFTEKLYVKTDKDIYIPGEKVWFKVWSFDNSFDQPLSLSKIGYIELLNSENVPVIRQKVGFKNSILNNAFFIPDTLSSGNYLLRVYTQWMRNFDPAFFCIKNILIINPFKNIKKLTQSNLDTITQNVTLGFYPEGGSFISGIQNHIVLKTSDRSGQGIMVKGILLINQMKVMDLQTDQNGYCSFNLKPASAGKYEIAIKYPFNKEQKFILPSPKESGITMHIIEKNESFGIDILSSNLSSKSNNIVMLSYGKGKVKKLGTLMLADSDRINIPKTDLSAGVNELIICGITGNVFCRRFVFIPPEKNYTVKIIPDDTIFQTRKKVVINLKSESTGGEYINSDLSVSVSRSIPIKTHIQYDKIENNRLIEMGIERSWFENILLDSGRLNYPPEIYGNRVSGSAFIKDTKKPAGNIPLCLAFPGKNFQCWFTRSRPDGKFVFTLNNYVGEKDIILSSASDSIPNLLFELDNPYSNKYSDSEKNPFFFDKTLIEYVERSSDNMQIETAKESNSVQLTDTTNKTCFYGKPDKVFVLDAYIKIPTVKELIEDLLSMVSIRKKGNRNQVVISGVVPKGKSLYVLGYDPLLLIDGVPVFNSDLFLQTNVPDIERIEIIYSTYYFGSIRFDGIINLITRKGTFNIDPGEESTRLAYPFLEPDKQFKMPDYSIPSEYNSRTPDFRTTLYWNPQVVLDKEGKATIEFYTSDDTGEYVIDVEGYTTGGTKIGEKRKIIVTN